VAAVLSGLKYKRERVGMALEKSIRVWKLELIDGIKEAWSLISLKYIEKLYESLPSRICEVLENGGGTTHY